jgi:hypothetical protein
MEAKRLGANAKGSRVTAAMYMSHPPKPEWAGRLLTRKQAWNANLIFGESSAEAQAIE